MCFHRKNLPTKLLGNIFPRFVILFYISVENFRLAALTVLSKSLYTDRQTDRQTDGQTDRRTDMTNLIPRFFISLKLNLGNLSLLIKIL